MDEKEVYKALENLTGAPDWKVFESLLSEYKERGLLHLAREPEFGRIRFLQGYCAAYKDVLDLPHKVMKAILEGRWKDDGG